MSIRTQLKHHTKCRVCGSYELKEYIDLGMLPLSNNLCKNKDDVPDRFPLKVLLCEECGLSQLSVVIDPTFLFGNYVYRSSINKGYIAHCNLMAHELKDEYGFTSDSFHIDIAGNDGALLNEFRKVIGGKMLNVDPAKNLVKICEEQNIRIYTTFWGSYAAAHLLNNNFPKADIITATNVFAHVDDVNDFLLGIKMILDLTGVCILEFPYIVDFIERVEFDTIYFEHLSYFGINPIVRMCNNLGMTVMKVEKKEIHGGTVRVHIGYGAKDPSVKEFLLKEYKYRDISKYEEFAQKAKTTIYNFIHTIKSIKKIGKTISGFAASAKGNTLLNCAGITNKEIDYIIDETPEKIGKYSPGTGIPIVPIPKVWTDFVLILSWNFAEEIKDKCIKHGFRGEFILPI